MKITVIESKRKTISIMVTPEGEVEVRAPLKTKDAVIEKVVKQKKDWIQKKLEKVQKASQQAKAQGRLTEKEIKELHDSAKRWIPERVNLYAPQIGVTPNRITIRKQKTRWGSCSRSGNLNFNCLLMLAPMEVLDSVVVHELCHLKQMNHSKAFYDEIYRVFPQYKKWNHWLDENGDVLMKRLG